MRLLSPGNSSKEAVNAKVERCVRTRSFEGGARYHRNRRHLTRTKSPKPGLVAEEDTVQPDQQSLLLPEQAQTGHELSAPCMLTNVPSGQADAINEPAVTSRQPEPGG